MSPSRVAGNLAKAIKNTPEGLDSEQYRPASAINFHGVVHTIRLSYWHYRILIHKLGCRSRGRDHRGPGNFDIISGKPWGEGAMQAMVWGTRGIPGRVAAWLLIGFAILLGGCSGVQKVAIISEPEEAFIKVNGVNVGKTPVNYDFNFKKRVQYKIVASKDGYQDAKVRVLKNNPGIRSGAVNVVLQEDPAYKATAFSDATNTWRRIAIDKNFTVEETWQRVIDSVTSVYDGLEQLDNSSGYLRSVRKTRAFGSGTKRFFIRTQFIGSFSGTAPLTYKYKIRSETKLEKESDESWEPYDRVFKNDAELSEELDTRLRVKGINN